MPRVKRGTISAKRRRNVLKKAKGYRFGRSTKEKEAKVALRKAGASAYRDRRNKKRTRRGEWQISIGAAVRPYDLSYSRFINLLKKAGIDLDRKVLSQLAQEEPQSFKRLVTSIKA